MFGYQTLGAVIRSFFCLLPAVRGQQALSHSFTARWGKVRYASEHSSKDGLRFSLKGGLVLLLLASSIIAHADKVDAYIKVQMQKRHIPGLSLAVIRDGKIIKVKGYGLANVETNTPASPDTVYKIASISKQFLAAGILLLVEDGKMGLEDKISKYLEGTPQSWKDITVRHLLTHTSGLGEDPPGFDPFKVQSDAEVVKSAYSTPLLFAPGEKWSYSNLGYFALGEILRKVSGKPWSEFLAERLFAPAGMTATRTTTTTEIVLHRASGYNWNHDQLENAENWVAVRPSGAFLTNVLDLAKWDAVLYLDSILKSSLREQMWTPVKLNNGMTHLYGMGWFLDPWQGHKRVDHQGALPGFLADFERFVDDKLTVIVMINSTSGDPTRIALSVAGFYVPALAPHIEKSIADTEPEITAKVKAMIAGFVGGNLDRSLFTPEMASLVVNKLTSQYSEDLRRPGAIQSIVLVERKNADNDRIYRYRLIYRNDSLFVICGFNKENKINGLGIYPE